MDCPKDCPNYEKVKRGETTYALGGRLKTIESFCCSHINVCEMWQEKIKELRNQRDSLQSAIHDRYK